MGKSSGPKSVSTLTGSQKDLMNLLIHQITPNLNQEATPFQGQIVPGLIPQYGQVMNQIQGYNPSQQNSQIQQALTQQLSGQPTKLIGKGLPKGYLQNTIMAPLLHEFDTKIAPRISQGFAGVGAFSSREGTALGHALSDLNVSAQQQFGQANYAQQQQAQQLNFQAAESAAQRQQNAIALGAQQTLLPLQQTSAISQLLNPFQQRADLQSQSRYQEFLRTIPENSPYFNDALALIGQSTKSFYNPPNPFAQAIGNVGGLLGIGGLLAAPFTGGASLLAGLPGMLATPFSGNPSGYQAALNGYGLGH
jgi:hypothetical protein